MNKVFVRYVIIVIIYDCSIMIMVMKMIIMMIIFATNKLNFQERINIHLFTYLFIYVFIYKNCTIFKNQKG